MTTNHPKAQWFRDAKFGLFIHYGLYSLLGKGEWVQYRSLIPIAEYAKLKERFTAAKFDAPAIATLAQEAGMKYITLVCKHCDSFCLWDTKTTEFNSLNSPARRDLVAEMATACRERGLGFFAFYEHGFDWRHPHSPAPWDWKVACRPPYDPPDPFYATREQYDFSKYVEYADQQVGELCSNYGPIAGVWLDGIAVPLSGDKSKFHVPELYAHIRRLQPEALICYKSGLYPELEDFMAPETPQVDAALKNRGQKPMEICRTLQEHGPKPAAGLSLWGWLDGARHLTADEVMAMLADTGQKNANLLLNVGPLPDGSIHPEDIQTLREVGRRIRKSGFPS